MQGLCTCPKQHSLSAANSSSIGLSPLSSHLQLYFGYLAVSLPPGSQIMVPIPKPGKDPSDPKFYHQIAFTMKKVYNATWYQGILLDLYAFNFRGCMLLFFRNFLSQLLFQVYIGSILSDPQEHEMDVLQGSVLAITYTLFNIKINSMLKCLSSFGGLAVCR